MKSENIPAKSPDDTGAGNYGNSGWELGILSVEF